MAAIIFLFAIALSGCSSKSTGNSPKSTGYRAIVGSEIGSAFDDGGDSFEESPLPPGPLPVGSPSGSASVRNTHVLKTAFSQVGKPYRYGGTKPDTGFDCSGFVRWVYGQYNISLPRRSGDMLTAGSDISRKELKPGDLVFFGKRKRITHVGIYTGDNKYIHSPSSGKSVRESSLDDRGRGEYYVGARRVLKNPGASSISQNQKMAWVEQAGQSMALAKVSAPRTAASGNIETPVEKNKAVTAKETLLTARAAPKVEKYRVISGDTIPKLSRKFDVEPELLAKINKISNYKTATLKPGQTILVPGREKEAPVFVASVNNDDAFFSDEQPSPAGGNLESGPSNPPERLEKKPSSAIAKNGRHKIERGDTFYAVAKKYGVKAADLASANNIVDVGAAVLHPGKTLIIPSAVGGNIKTAETGRMAEAAPRELKAVPAAAKNTATVKQSRSHTIENGDTFYGVAQKYGVKAVDLARANNIADINSAVLRPGKTLLVPAKTAPAKTASSVAQARAENKIRNHKVENGDTFYGVAKKYGVKSTDLAKANNIADIKTAVLKPGQTLVVPRSSAN